MKIFINSILLFFIITNVSNADLIKPNPSLKPIDVILIQPGPIKTPIWDKVPNIEDNPFLRDFYNDRKRCAFQTQINFLISRYYQQLRLQQVDLFADKIISDYMFAKDKLFAQTSLDDNEMLLYQKMRIYLQIFL